jgi:isopenicillin N synthase-like dioxygenase
MPDREPLFKRFDAFSRDCKEPTMLDVSRRADFSEIPMIDMGALGSGGMAEDDIVRSIREASEHVGFFYVRNHGVPLAETHGMFAACAQFFAMPQAQRDALYLINSPNYRGYLPIGVLGQNTERPRDLLESFNVGMELGADDPDVRNRKPLHGVNQWPDGIPGFRDAVMRYYGLMDALMRRLLQGFALAAELPRDGFDRLFTKPLTQMRLLHYPAQDVPQGNMIGARAHRDFGFFTILLQDDVGGLEVSNQAGEWVVAPPIEGTFVINVAEMLKLATNGRFASALHRVINRYGRERYSVPFFANPSFDAVLEPLAQFIDDAHPVQFTSYPVGEKMLNFYRSLWPSAGKVPA